MMDHGYPQITSVHLLQQWITLGKAREMKSRELSSGSLKANMRVVDDITNRVDWRPKGKNYSYTNNQVYIDIVEKVNLLLSSTGDVLRSDVSGRIVIKAYLSGMPECKFGLNDKLVLNINSAKNVRKSNGITIDDVILHRCVQLNKFDADRSIAFIPPDGTFELMKYRVTQGVALPFKIKPHVVQHGRTRVEYSITIKGNFSTSVFATNIVLKIPTPPNTAKCKVKPTMGKTKYSPAKNAIFWKIKRFAGNGIATLSGEVNMLASMKDNIWSRPPISMDFQVGLFTSSGLNVRYFIVNEDYDTGKFVKYITRAGAYQIRI